MDGTLAENLDPGAHDLSGVVAELGLEEEAERPLDVASTISPTVKIVKPKGLAAHFHCPNTLPLPSLWPDRPLLLRESSLHEVRHGRYPQIPNEFMRARQEGGAALAHSRHASSAPLLQF